MPLREIIAGTGTNGQETPEIDIVAVHGLNSLEAKDLEYNTWRKPANQDGTLWLRDNFSHAQPNARIFIYKYNSRSVFGGTKDGFVREANQLLEGIYLKRGKIDNKRPLIFIGHSLGGLLINYGLVLFGTPHARPGEAAQINFGKACMRIAQTHSNPNLGALEDGSLFDELWKESFKLELEHYRIVSFYEGIGELVPYDSAVIGLSGAMENQVRIDAEHSDMCRFDLSIEEDRDNYELVEGNLIDLCSQALTSAKKQQATPGNILSDQWRRSLQGSAEAGLPIEQNEKSLPIITHMIQVPGFAWQVYRACQKTSPSFHDIADDVSNLHAALKGTKETLEGEAFTIDVKPKAQELSTKCCGVLHELQNLLDEYETWGTQTQRVWSCTKTGAEKLKDLKFRLQASILEVKSFNSSLSAYSLTQLENLLKKFISEIRAGQRSASAISSTDTLKSILANSKRDWIVLQRELEDIGVAADMIAEQREFIVKWFSSVIFANALQVDEGGTGSGEFTSMQAATEPIRTIYSSGPSDQSVGMDGLPLFESEEDEPQTKFRVSPSIKRGQPVIQPGDSTKVDSASLNRILGISGKINRAPVSKPPGMSRQFAISPQLTPPEAYWALNTTDSFKQIDSNTAFQSANIGGLLRPQLKHVEPQMYLADLSLREAHANASNQFMGVGGLPQTRLEEDETQMYLGELSSVKSGTDHFEDTSSAASISSKSQKKSRLSKLLSNAFSPTRPSESELCAAVLARDFAKVEELLELGARIDSTDHDERLAALDVAVDKENGDMVELLCEKGKTTYVKDDYLFMVLQRAIERDKWNSVKPLLNQGAVPYSTDVALVARKGNCSVLRLMLEKGIGPEPQKLALSTAIRYGHTSIVQLLLEKGVDINSEHQTSALEVERIPPLHTAARYGHTAMIQLLLRNGADVKTRCKPHYSLSAYRGGYTALHYGSIGGSTSSIEQLLRCGINIEAEGVDGRRPLMMASIHGNENAVQFLLDKGAEAKARDKEGWTALSLACAKGSRSIVALLLRRAKVISKEQWGWTPLHFAICVRCSELVPILIASGADLTIRADTRCPLFDEVLKRLRHGKEAQRKRAKRMTALETARFLGYEDIVQLLENASHSLRPQQD